MESNIKRFLGYIEDNLVYDKEKLKCVGGVDMYNLSNLYNSYTFNLAARRNELFSSNNEFLISLDSDDIEYFVNKYKNKLEDEMNYKINEIKKQYGK